MALKKLDELIEDFSLFEDWEERYAYLIECGRQLPPMVESLKTEGAIVKGCTSRVWLVAERRPKGRFHFIADSDAQIVRGLIYLLLCAYQDKTPAEIAGYDIESAFERLGLYQHLSPNRRNGFFAMMEKIRTLASTSPDRP
ncbi:MAG: SufE family protein [Alphaproteobacteria bacterium]|nr:SufE family protein [Alphaproteobacteria bacterium]